jgi:hypothetical protein
MNTIGGLPAHPLMVHVPVALVPLAMLGVFAMAVRRSWFERLWVAVTVVIGVGLAGTFLAAGSGEELEEGIRSSGQNISAALQDHAEMGEGAEVAVAAFAVVFFAWVSLAWWAHRAGQEKAVALLRRPGTVHGALAVLTAIGAIVATVIVYKVGHSGATSVWEG